MIGGGGGKRKREDFRVKGNFSYYCRQRNAIKGESATYLFPGARSFISSSVSGRTKFRLHATQLITMSLQVSYTRSQHGGPVAFKRPCAPRDQVTLSGLRRHSSGLARSRIPGAVKNSKSKKVFLLCINTGQDLEGVFKNREGKDNRFYVAGSFIESSSYILLAHFSSNVLEVFS